MKASSGFLTVFLLVSLGIFEVNSCDFNCPYKPVFTPSSLVVKYGDPAFATCVACQSGCNENLTGLEISSGFKDEIGSTIKWNVSSLTEWDSDPICFYTTGNGTQCCSTLTITVYQAAQDVSFSVFNHSGPMLENSQYTLVCVVRDVAPAGKLVVTFYRGQTELSQPQFYTTSERKPVTATFPLSFTATKEDDGAQFSCGAKLDLGPEGPQRPLVVRSQNLTTTVYCKSGKTVQLTDGPELQDVENQISIYKGETLQLNCSSAGNPDPSYSWILPFSDSSNANSVLTFKSVGFDHKGRYNCTVSNSVKTVSVIFEVDVKENYIPYIIAATVVLAVMVLIIVAVKTYHCYKHKHIREYPVHERRPSSPSQRMR